MSLQSAADVPLLISSPNSSSERRISPSWSIAHLKSRLEPITGVPASSQQLSLRVGSQDAVPISAVDEEQTRLAQFPLQPYAEITVSVSIPVSPITAKPALHFPLFLANGGRPLSSCHISSVSVQLRGCSLALVDSLLQAAIRCLGHIPEAVLINVSYLHRLHAPHCPSSALKWMELLALLLRGSERGAHIARGFDSALSGSSPRSTLLFGSELFSSIHCPVRIGTGRLYPDERPQQCCADESPETNIIVY
jgi:hypothetical protein